jgi:chloramphenicol 3-O-phosphotransferase
MHSLAEAVNIYTGQGMNIMQGVPLSYRSSLCDVAESLLPH